MVQFPIQATPSPAIDTMMPTIIKARVAWSEPGDDKNVSMKTVQQDCVGSVKKGIQ